MKHTRKILVALLVLMTILMSLVVTTIPASAAETMDGDEILFLVPSSYWKQANARFAAYFFGSSGNQWVSMTKVNDNLYVVAVPSGKWTNVIFCRMNPNDSTNSWDTKWNQTSDLSFDGSNNCYSVKANTWDNGGGTWSTKALTFTAAGSIDNSEESAGFFGTSWDPANESNNLELQDDGTYKKVYTNVPAGDYRLKVVLNNAWTLSWPTSDQKFTVNYSNSTVTVTFNLSSKEVIVTSVCEHTNTTTTTVDAKCTVNGSKTVTCDACGETLSTETLPATGHINTTTDTKAATCIEAGYTKVTCSCGHVVSDVVAPATFEHSFSEGYCSVCGAKELVADESSTTSSEATISFADVANRTEQTTSVQVWAQNGITVTNNKAGSTSNIIDSSNPVRFYKSSELIIAYPGMTKIVVACNTESYATALINSISSATVTVDGKVVTIEFDVATDSYSVTLSGGQVRVDSITVYAEATGEPACSHENTTTKLENATCTEAGKIIIDCDACEKYTSVDNVNDPALGHDINDDHICTVCGEDDPEYYFEMSIDEALAAAEGKQVKISGTVVEIYQAYNETFDNISVYIQDENGKQISLYRLSGNVSLHDIITVEGTIALYSGANQVTNGTFVLDGKEECTFSDATCTEPAKCEICDATKGEALGHIYSGNNCSVCGAEKPSVGDTTVSVTIADYADSKGWVNGTQYTSVAMGTNITVTVSGDGNTGKYYTSGENWRIYQSENPSIVISSGSGYVIKSVKITYSVSNTGVLQLNGENITSETLVTVNAESITFGVGNTGSATNGQVRITAIEVVYAAEEECAHTNKTTTTVDSTCEVAGSVTVTCDDCGDTISTEALPLADHTSGEATKENLVEATCKAAGSYEEVVKCSVCGEELSRTNKTIDKLAHTEVVDEAVDATCTTAGKTEGKHCSVCNEILVAQTEIPALDHIDENNNHVCDRGTCDFKVSECADADKNHICDFGGCAKTLSDHADENKDHFCDYEGCDMRTSNCTPGAATKENLVEATCKAAGSYEEVVKCSACGEELSRTNKTIDKLAHTEVVDEAVEAACTTAGKTEGKHCSVCNEVIVAQTEIPAKGHSYTSSVTTEATCGKAGVRTYTCTCGDSYTEEIPATGEHSFVEGVCSVCSAADPDYVAPTYVAEINGVKYETLQAAVNAVKNGETILFLGDITETLVTIEKASGVAFTIDGNSYNFTGEFEIGIGENIVIKNIDFVATSEISPVYFIDSMDQNSNCVLDIQNCTFTDTDYSTTAIGTHQPTNVKIDGCTANGVASLLQNQGGYNITVKNTSIEGKRGISLGSVIGATVEKVTIKAADDKYGIRLNGENTNNTITIKDCDIEAFIPVVVRKAQVENYNVIFDGTNTMTPKNTDGLWCAIGADEYETNGTMPTAPTGKVTVTLNDSGLNTDGLYGNYAPVTHVAMINGQGYATLAEALEAAKTMSGDVVVEILDKVTLNSAISGSFDSITFVGKDTDAEIYLDVQGYITATGKTVSFNDLTLSKAEGGYLTNAGFMNVAFGVYDVLAVNYTNCTFTNGSYASSGKVTYTDCTFYRSYDKYGLWAYGDTEIVVNGCTFDDYRGIKMYAEGAAKTTNLTVKNTDFSALDSKPAIVLTYGESVTLEGNTYSDTGVFELDLDGAPNGTAVTSTDKIICKNDKGDCGVLVDGKIYTTVADAAAVATEGSTVTLLHSSTETVELAEGVTLDKNGYTADGVTVRVPVYLVEVNGVKYESISDAMAAAKEAGIANLVITIIGTNDSTTEDTFNLAYGTAFDNVTIKQDNGGQVYYIAGIYTGDRTSADGKFIFDGVNIISTSNIWFECDVVLTNNSLLTRTDDSKNFVFNGALTIEPGSRFVSQIDDIMSGTITVDGGKTDGTYCDEAGFRTIFFDIRSGQTFYVKNGAYVLVNAANELGRITLNGVAYVYDSKIDVFNNVIIGDNAALYLNTNSIVNAQYITGNGVISIDATNISSGSVLVVSADMSGFTGTVEIIGNDNATYEITEEGLVISYNPLSGEGTEDNPYIINSVEALFYFAEQVNGGNSYDGAYFKLDADIDLSAVSTYSLRAITPNWTPIGTKAAPFKGEFDGNGKTVSNIIVVGEENQGFFGYADNAIIKNLTLENVTVIGTDCVGGIAGQVYSVSLIDNCHVKGLIQIEGQTNVGGIVGKYYTKVTNCSVIGDGVNTSYIKGVYVASDFEGDNIGGIMGHCGENNSLTGNTVKNITISGTRKVGGIVGIADQNTDVQNCVVENVVIETTATVEYAQSKVTSMSIGGLIGQYQAAGSNPDGTVKGCEVSHVTFTIPAGVTCEAGMVVGGARGGSNGMLAPSTNVEATDNSVDIATITGATNDYLMVAVAKIGETKYYSLADAIAAAQAGDEIILLADVAEDITVPAGVIFNGNGKQVGVITAEGEITFKGHTKATNFGTKYTNTTINIVEGACLEITGTDRLVIGHGCTFNITGNITDAKTADKTAIQPSLIIPGASFTGAGVTFNVTNAYIKAPSSYCSSSKSASGTFDFNITNSIVETAGKLAFESQSTAATVNFELKDSVLTTGSHLVFGVSRGEIVIDNSNVNVGTSKQIENQSTLIIKNGSVVNGAVATSSNAKNPGTLIIDNATYAVTGEFSGSDLGVGTLIIKNGGSFTAGSVTKANIKIDATGMSAGDEINITANLSKLAGTIEVINNDSLEAKIVDGKIVLSKKPVAKIGETEYATLEEAFKAATAGCTIEILTDVVIDYKWDARNTGAKFTVPVTIDGNGHKITFTGVVNDGFNYYSAFRFEADATVKNLTVDMSQAVSEFQGRFRAISAKANLTVDGCTFIGNGSANNTRAIIFGEGGTAESLANVAITITGSNFEGWRQAIGDNESGKTEVKTVVITDNKMTDAGVNVSAYDSITFNGNTVDGKYVKLVTYAENNTLTVTATGNTLTANGTGNNQNYTNANTANVQNDFVRPARGEIAYRGYIEDGANREAIKIDLQKVYATTSVVVKLYDANGNLLTTTTLKAGGYEGDWLTTNIVLSGTASGSWDTVISAELTVANVPTKVELWIDGELLDTFEPALGNETDAAAYQLPAYLALDSVYKAAKIGDNYYMTFADAYNAAVAGDTIVLLDDALVKGKFVIAKAITIDGQGHSIKADETATWYTVGSKPLYLKSYKTHLIGVNSDNVTLKSITLDCNNLAAGINIYCAQNVVFENVAVINATKGFAGITVNGSTLTSKGSLTVLGNAIALDISNGSGVTSSLGFAVEDGCVLDLGNKTVKFASVATIDITGAENAAGDSYFAAMDNAYLYTEEQMNARTSAYSNGLILLDDVTVTNDLTVKGTLDLNGNDLFVGGNLKTTGALNIVGNGSITADAVLSKENQSISAPEGSLNITGTVDGYMVVYEDGAYKLAKVVAEINGTQYAYLADAVAAAQDGETITLVADVILTDRIKVSGKSFNIEGNGNVITGTGALWLLSGTYNINNVVFDNITYTGGYGILEFTYANATITGCTFSNNTANNCIAVDCNANNDGNSNVIIEGCTITGNECSTSVINSAEGSTTVKDSAITNNTANIAVVYNSASFNASSCYFNGNTLTGTNKNKAVILTGPWVEGNYTVAITGNAFLDELVAVYVENWISGITNDLDGNYWRDGNKPVAGTDYIVDAGADANIYDYCTSCSYANGVLTLDGSETITYIAQIGVTKYETLADALAAVADGATVTLLTDVSLESLELDKEVTIDGNGKTITAAIKVSAKVIINNANIVGVAGNKAVITITSNADLTVQGGKITALQAISARNGASVSTESQYILLAENANGARAYIDAELVGSEILSADADDITCYFRADYADELAARGYIVKADENNMVKVTGSVPYYIGADGYWYFNGEKTEHKAIATDGVTPHIGDNGNWFIGTEDTGVKAKAEDGTTPHIGDNGNWFIGTKDTGYKAIATDGVTPHIGDNGNWFIGTKDTGVKAAGTDATIPHIGTNGNWFIGTKDTEVKAAGVDGKTPYIGTNGNWWIGEEDLKVPAKGKDGEDGKTPYIGSNGNWWVGTTDLGTSAKGEDGKTPIFNVIDGYLHYSFDNGENWTKIDYDLTGKEGLTPSIGENGNWFIGGVDTKVPAKAQDGKTPHIGENGNWFIGTEDTGVKAKAEDGTTPHIGDNGNWFIGTEDTGVRAQGLDGKTPAFKIESDNLWVSYDDGKTWTDLGTVVGEDGKTPHIGENGNWWIGDFDTGVKAKGDDGAAGATPYIGENGNWWIGDSDTGVAAKGEDGKLNQEIILICIAIAGLCIITTIIAVATRKYRRPWWILN